jgi:hypothetical protein
MNQTPPAAKEAHEAKETHEYDCVHTRTMLQCVFAFDCPRLHEIEDLYWEVCWNDTGKSKYASDEPYQVLGNDISSVVEIRTHGCRRQQHGSDRDARLFTALRVLQLQALGPR